MKNKLKYIFSALLVIGATVIMVLAPDMTFFGAGSRFTEEENYMCEATPLFSPLESCQVAEVFTEGRFINRYDYYESDTNEIRRLSLAAAEQFFAADSETAEIIKNKISGEDIDFEQVHSVIAVVDDRMVSMEFVTVGFRSEVNITFEKNTLTVLSLQCIMPFDLAEKTKYAGEYTQSYIDSYIKNKNAAYSVYCYDIGFGESMWEFCLVQRIDEGKMYNMEQSYIIDR
ncbi:MAG: hypothetical protein IKJ83_04180 [Ruminococcus sp.]|nr:hypothetical protein [Ruminococcus sp.]